MMFIWVSIEIGNNTYTLWDLRVPRESHELYQMNETNVRIYYPIEVESLENKTVRVYFNWEHMPLVGWNYKKRRLVGVHKFDKAW